MLKKMILTVLLPFLAVQYSLGHDAWIENKDGKLVVIYGHGKDVEPYEPVKVKEAKAFDSKGEVVPVEIAKQKDSVTLEPKGKPATVAAFYDGGCWVKTTDGWKNITKREAQGKYTVMDSSKSRKYAKSLLAPCDSYDRPSGMVMEIVPEKDPFAVKSGETLPIKVLMDGKPFEGAEIAYGDAGHSDSKDKLKTDKDGKASIVIAKPGFQIIVASYRTPLKDDPDADNLGLGASLTFEIK